MNVSNQFEDVLKSGAAGLPMDEARLEELFDTVLEGVQAGATFKDMYGVSSDTMEAVYGQAYRFYQQGRLNEAETLFRLLCVYDFYNVDYALGLGAVFQLKKQYGKALDVYGMAYTIGGGDQRAMFYAGECNLLLRRMGKARRCFELVVEEGGDDRIKGRAQAYLRAMRNVAAPGDGSGDGIRSNDGLSDSE